MIRALHAISTLLFVTALGILLFNVMWQFAEHGQIKIFSVEEAWNSFDKGGFQSVKGFLGLFIPTYIVEVIAQMPAAAVPAILAALVYVPLRIMILFGFGKKRKVWRQ